MKESHGISVRILMINILMCVVIFRLLYLLNIKLAECQGSEILLILIFLGQLFRKANTNLFLQMHNIFELI